MWIHFLALVGLASLGIGGEYFRQLTLPRTMVRVSYPKALHRGLGFAALGLVLLAATGALMTR